MALNQAALLKYAWEIDTAFGLTKHFWLSATLSSRIELTVSAVISRSVITLISPRVCYRKKDSRAPYRCPAPPLADGGISCWSPGLPAKPYNHLDRLWLVIIHSQHLSHLNCIAGKTIQRKPNKYYPYISISLLFSWRVIERSLRPTNVAWYL